MFWLVPVALKILCGDLWGSWLLKVVSHERSRLTRFAINYFVAAVIASALAFLFGQFSFDRLFFILIIIGFANGFAAYAQWRAIDISLSKSYLFNWGYGVIAMILGFFLLSESKFLNTFIGLGIAISIVSAICLAYCGYQRQKNDENPIPKKNIH